MSSKSKKDKCDKRKHWGRGGSFLKSKGKGIKGITFFNGSQRQENKRSKDNDEK